MKFQFTNRDTQSAARSDIINPSSRIAGSSKDYCLAMGQSASGLPLPAAPAYALGDTYSCVYFTQNAKRYFLKTESRFIWFGDKPAKPLRSKKSKNFKKLKRLLSLTKKFIKKF